jgi:hypothetical protein
MKKVDCLNGFLNHEVGVELPDGTKIFGRLVTYKPSCNDGTPQVLVVKNALGCFEIVRCPFVKIWKVDGP